MKNLFYGLIALCLFTVQSSTANNTPRKNQLENVVMKRHTIRGTLHMSNGCTAAYTITVDVTMFPPDVTLVGGTVTFSGTCTGTQTFTGPRLPLDQNNNILLVTTTISGDPKMLDELHTDMATTLNAAGLFR